MAFTELLTYTMEWNDANLPLGDFAVKMAKNVPSIVIGEWFAAVRLRRTGRRSSRENPWPRKSSSDHRLDWAPVTAMAETSAWTAVIITIIIIYLLILRVLHMQMLTRALQYNNYLTVHTQIRKKNYIVHFVTINNEEEKKIKTTAIDSLYNLCNC